MEIKWREARMMLSSPIWEESFKLVQLGKILVNVVGWTDRWLTSTSVVKQHRISRNSRISVSINQSRCVSLETISMIISQCIRVPLWWLTHSLVPLVTSVQIFLKCTTKHHQLVMLFSRDSLHSNSSILSGHQARDDKEVREVEVHRSKSQRQTSMKRKMGCEHYTTCHKQLESMVEKMDM